MREGLLKTLIRRVVFPDGAIRTIRLGPLKGQRFQVSAVTGMAPWYSGAERDHQALMAAYVHAGDTVIDVGANWGVHTLLLARLVGPSGRVFACEPYPPAFDALRWHVAENGHAPYVTICPMAASSRDGTSTFHVGPSAAQGRLADDGAGITVRLRRLDDLWDDAGRPRVSFIKIDTEGHERMVLDGAAHLIARDHPVLLIAPDATSDEAAIIRKHLEEWKYRYRAVDDGGTLLAEWPKGGTRQGDSGSLGRRS